MSGCDFEALEAWVLGELDGAAEGELRAHLATCADCQEELALLREERALFAARAAHQPSPPGFAAVLARARWTKEPAPARAARVTDRAVDRAPSPPPRAHRLTWAAIAVAAAAAIVFFPRAPAPPPQPGDDAEIHAEPAACFDDGARMSVAPVEPWTVGAPTNEPPCDEAAHEPAPEPLCSGHCDGVEQEHECDGKPPVDVTNGCFAPSDEQGGCTP
ncbi:MAG: zf-HC2 domain-containing protein [Byssovorax sp.]